MNLPNRLTILRVCLIPVFIVFLMLDEMLPWARYAAVGVFIAACITDFFDGRIARKYNMVTNFRADIILKLFVNRKPKLIRLMYSIFFFFRQCIGYDNAFIFCINCWLSNNN